jgi:dCMP deaminase
VGVSLQESKKLRGKNGVINMDLTNEISLWQQPHLVRALTNSDKLRDTKWAYRFLELAEHVGKWSKDPSTKVGAVIANDENRIVSLGYNGFPRGVIDSETRYNNRDVKYQFVCHAERNAIDNAHTDISGCTIYVTLLPCNECAKSIIQRGIKKVVCLPSEEDKPHCNWNITVTMFKEAGVQLEFLAK